MSVDRFWAQRALASWWPSRQGRYSVAPFVGYLELCGDGDGGVSVGGWVFSAGAPVRRLTARIGDGAEVVLAYGTARVDIGAAYRGVAGAASSGFSGQVPSGGGGVLRIFGETMGGRRLLVFERAIDAGAAQGRQRRVVERLRASTAARAALAAAVPGLDAAPILDGLAREAAARGVGAEIVERWFSAPLTRPVDAAPSPARGRRRLLFVSAMFPSTAHGGGLRLYDIIDGLAERADIDLYSTYRADLDAASLAALAPRLGAVRLVPGDELDDADVRDWLARHRRHAYDAVHFEWPQTAPLVAALAGVGGRRIFTLMECVTRAAAIGLSRAATDGALAAAAWRFAVAWGRERQAVGAAHHTVAVSGEDADFAARVFAVPRPVVVPTCLSEHAFLRGLPDAVDAPPPPEAVFVGYFDHYPNHDAIAWYLRHVHDAVRARLPGYRLRIVGRGDLTSLRALRPDPSVLFVGPVVDLPAALRAGRMGLAPMVSGAGMRGKLNQHAAAFRPVVSTSLGAEGLPYRDGQDILVADEPAAFADAVVRLGSDDALWRRLATAARTTALGAFRWAPHLATLEALHG